MLRQLLFSTALKTDTCIWQENKGQSRYDLIHSSALDTDGSQDQIQIHYRVPLVSPRDEGTFLSDAHLHASDTVCLPDVREIFDLFDFWDGRDGEVDGAKIGDLLRCAGLNPTNDIVKKNGGCEKFGSYIPVREVPGWNIPPLFWTELNF